MGWGEGRVGQREWEKEERETEGGMGEGETYQVSGILFDGSLECNQNQIMRFLSSG